MTPDDALPRQHADTAPASGSALSGDEVLPIFRQSAPAVVPIRRIGAEHKAELLAHFLALDASDRYLRFGCAANDAQIRAYVDRIDFVHHEVFGVFNRKLDLIAVAHLAPSESEGSAEFGVSVLPSARAKGIGTRLFQRAAMYARNHGIQTLTMQCLTQNAPMMRIARHAGMRVHVEGSETEGALRVPAQTLFSHLDEWMENATGQLDFVIKLGMHRPQAV